MREGDNQEFKSWETPERRLLNSFFLGDLAAAAEQFARERSMNLRRYLGVVRAERYDPRTTGGVGLGRSALLVPDWTLAWPGPTAACVAPAGVRERGDQVAGRCILVANGPPGAGKSPRCATSRARVEQANVTAGFDEPAGASCTRATALGRNSCTRSHKPDLRRTGFEILGHPPRQSGREHQRGASWLKRHCR